MVKTTCHAPISLIFCLVFIETEKGVYICVYICICICIHTHIHDIYVFISTSDNSLIAFSIFKCRNITFFRHWILHYVGSSGDLSTLPYLNPFFTTYPPHHILIKRRTMLSNRKHIFNLVAYSNPIDDVQ